MGACRAGAVSACLLVLMTGCAASPHEPTAVGESHDGSQ